MGLARVSWVVGLIVLVAWLPACQRSRVAENLDPLITQGGEGSEMEFWHQLPGRSAVTNSEALHGVLLFSDGADATATWEDRLALLRERGWVVDGFSEPGDATVSRGTLAKALCHALQIRGGVMMHLSGTAPRYALRELAYERIMASSSENQVVSGLDYVGIISRAQDWAMLRESKAAAAVEGTGSDGTAEPVPETPAAPAGGESSPESSETSGSSAT